MSSDRIATFESSLSDAATVVRTTAAAFDDRLSEHVERPAIGVSLPFGGVSLPEDVGPPETATDLRAATTGITPAGLAIADYGTVTVDDADEGELVALYPERHVAVVAASDLVPDAPTAFDRLQEPLDRGRSTVLATGPSVTADMGAIVEGVHGPRDVRVIVLEDR